MRPCTMGESTRRHFAVGLFVALIWKFLTKYSDINLIFYSDKVSADSKCWNRFVSQIILSFSME